MCLPPEKGNFTAKSVGILVIRVIQKNISQKNLHSHLFMLPLRIIIVINLTISAVSCSVVLSREWLTEIR